MTIKRLLPLAGPLALLACTQSAAAQIVRVAKDPNCGCCTEWVDHMRDAGFVMVVEETDELAKVAADLGVPPELRSCHTASVEGYAIEGHVPASDVRRLLSEKPEAIGLAVPGMPVGSPGMEVGDRVDPYQVVLIDRAGRHTVFATYNGNDMR